MTDSALYCLLRLGLGYVESSDEDVQALSSLDTDGWNDLIDLSFDQGIDAITVDGYHKWLDNGGGECLLETDEGLEDLKFEWFGSVLQAETDFSQYLSSAASLAKLYADNGIKTLVLKGLVFSECYPNPAHRTLGDMDCFLSDDFEKGNQLIEREGLNVNRHYFKNSSFDYKGLHVENHHYFTAFRGSRKSKDYERLLQQEITAGETGHLFDSDLLSPPVMFSALFCISHAQTHFLTEGITLRHICDWALFRKRHQDEIDWNHFESVCREYGMWSFAQTVTRIGNYLLGEAEYTDLTEPDLLLLDDTLHRTSEEKMSGMKRRVQLIMKSLRSSWKYKYFSDQNVLEHVIQRVVGYFEKAKLD